MNTSIMTRHQLMSQIDGHVSIWLGFKTGLAGLTNKNKAALEFLCKRTAVMAEQAKIFEGYKAELGERIYAMPGFKFDDPEVQAKFDAAWAAYMKADDIWANLWEGYDGPH